jgi:integrase
VVHAVARADGSELFGAIYVTAAFAGLRMGELRALRHTFGTLAVQAFALSGVRAMMGHADISTTMIYVHHVPRTDAASRLSALLEKGEAASASSLR